MEPHGARIHLGPKGQNGTNFAKCEIFAEPEPAISQVLVLQF